MNQLAIALLLSFSPISELRGGIPFAIANGINPFVAFFSCIAINSLVAPIIFLFLETAHKKLFKNKVYKNTFNKFLKKIERIKRRVGKAYTSYGLFALVLFVAIPFPSTGAWTASIVAWLLKLEKIKSILAITLGVIIAGIIVTLTTLGIIKLF
ncbi:MAG TPA: ligand-binding protein SH3 [Candidatus Pacearchaeota archaeon]|nr:ligand-binding protein SH3 [Candidatus Pacearchaeota archaeon]